jgi:hypothetical protein
MWRVMPSLLLGDVQDARDLPALKREGITHIVNCASELPCYFGEDFVYLSLSLRDPDAQLGAQIEKACEFIDEGRKAGKVLVHCIRAGSRSPAVVLAYLCHAGYPVHLAAERLAAIVSTRPHQAFLRQLADYLGLKLSDAEFEDLSIRLLGRT